MIQAWRERRALDLRRGDTRQRPVDNQRLLWHSVMRRLPYANNRFARAVVSTPLVGAWAEPAVALVVQCEDDGSHFPSSCDIRVAVMRDVDEPDAG